MDLSILKLQDPKPGFPGEERRRRIRHRLHTPVYASISGPNPGMVLDLSELLDVHEDGFAVQTNGPLEVDRPVNVCLDLPETRTYIHGTGHVVWSDGTGRGGIRLSELPEQPRRLLKEWLFINLLIACANHTARTQQRSQREVEPVPLLPPLTDLGIPTPVPDLSGVLSAVEAVRSELREHSGDFNSALQLVTERALSLTGASGAALAFLTKGEMICRAKAGDPAPPLGSAVDVKQGFSGECARSGRLIACENTGTDPRVDQEVCRMLGIGSILAAPIFSDFRVVGLLEVFSPDPLFFTRIHETALDRLVELVPKVEPPEPSPPQPPPDELLPPPAETPFTSRTRDALWEPETEAQEPLNAAPIRYIHLALLVATVALAALVSGYVLAPTIERRWLTKQEPTRVQAASADTSVHAGNAASEASNLEDLRKLAEQGNADAQWNMGVRYHNGEGVPQDDTQAVQWFLRAAKQGHVAAQATLGAYYWAGRGVPPDLPEAYFWSALALAQGDEASKSRLEGLASQMTRAQVTAARQQADEWIRQRTRVNKLN
jgi:uncharacterized protein